MTLRKFLIATVIQLFISLVLKIYFFKTLGFHSEFSTYLYLVLIVALSTGAVRMLGIINFFEGMFVAGFWFMFGLFLDVLITSHLASNEIYKTKELWLGYVATMFCAFWFHKKYHIHIRHKMHSHHH